MRKATITDIAIRAEVSTATVDRVLNGRAGASAANRQRVLTAAKALGYLPSEDKVTLPSRPAHLEFFIPLVAANSCTTWPAPSGFFGTSAAGRLVYHPPR